MHNRQEDQWSWGFRARVSKGLGFNRGRTAEALAVETFLIRSSGPIKFQVVQVPNDNFSTCWPSLWWLFVIQIPADHGLHSRPWKLSSHTSQTGWMTWIHIYGPGYFSWYNFYHEYLLRVLLVLGVLSLQQQLQWQCQAVAGKLFWSLELSNLKVSRIGSA